MKILVFTSVLPVADISHKKRENNVILETEMQIKNSGYNIDYQYVYIQPYANRFLSKLSSKWKEYYDLRRKGYFITQGKRVVVLSVLMLPLKTRFRCLFYGISWWLYKKKVKKILTEYNPQIVHAQDSDVSGFFAKQIKDKHRIPYVISLRGINFVFDNSTKKILSSADSLLAISMQQNIIASSNGFALNTNFIPHGVDDIFFRDVQSESKGNVVRFVIVARLLKLKNIDKIIMAMANIEKDFKFHVYGEGPEKEYLEILVKENHLEGKVMFKGYIENSKLPDVLSTYDVFIMPSYPETLGRVYFEAMACGLPVIASKGTGVDGIINKDHGFLIQPTVDELGKIINFIVDNPVLLYEMSVNVRLFVEKFRWKNISERYVNLYSKIIKKG